MRIHLSPYRVASLNPSHDFLSFSLTTMAKDYYTIADARKVAAALVVISHYKRKQRQKRKHRWWITQIYRQRNVHVKQMLSDMTFEGVEDTIKNFTRMNSESFEDLCFKLEPMIGKKDTSFRKAITTKKRLPVFL